MFAAPSWTDIMFDLNHYHESEPRITNNDCTDANAFAEKYFGHMKRTFNWENMLDQLNVCVFIRCVV